MSIFTAEYTFASDLTYPIYVKARQVQRNGVALDWASCTNVSADVWVDKTAPVVSISGLYLNATATQNAINNQGYVTTATVYLAYTITDPGSGIATSTYSYNGGASATLTASPMSLTLSENPTIQTILEIKGTDNAGNFATAQIPFYVDTAVATSTDAPIIARDGRSVYLIIPNYVATNNLGYNQFAFYNFSTDELIVEVTSDTNIGSYTFDSDLTYKVYGKAKQVKKSGIAGAYSSSSGAVWVDITPPVFTISGYYTDASGTTDVINEYNFITQETLYVDFAASDTGSGIFSMTYQINSAAAVSWSTATATARFIVDLTGSASGAKSVAMVVTDNIGLATTIKKDFLYDMDYPADADTPTLGVNGRTITATIPNYSQTTNYLQTEFQIRSASGSEIVIVTSLSDKMTYTFATDLTYQVNVKARQKKLSGRVLGWASCTNTSSNVWIDITDPTLTVSTTGIGIQYCTVATATVIASATDEHSGIASVRAIVDGVTSSTLTNGVASDVSLGADSLNKTLEIIATDNNGNTKTWEREFIKDTVAPTGLAGTDITSTFGRYITWNIDLSCATDATSGLAGIEVRSTDAGWGSTGYVYRGQEPSFIQKITSGASASLWFALYDKAGNYQTAFAATATNLPPADVTSATITATSEINSINAKWTAVASNTDGTVTDDIDGYQYCLSYKDATGAYITSSTLYTTQSAGAYIPFPSALLIPNQTNSMKVHIKTIDVWGSTSANWATSTAFDIRQVNGPDLANNAFQFKVTLVHGLGSATTNYTTTGETLDTTLETLVDGDFS